MQTHKLVGLLILSLIFLTGGINIYSQEKKEDKKEDKAVKSIGGEEHEANIYGVKVGMDIPTALEAVFVNAKRKPGQEKPDAMKKEGADKKDVRVVYKNLPKGELQILFADGKYVKEVILFYKSPIQYSDLRLPYRGDVGIALAGQRYDDRYTLGYTDNQAIQATWHREEKGDGDYKIRVIFTSNNRIKESQFEFQKIVQKAVMIAPGDEQKFLNFYKDKN